MKYNILIILILSLSMFSLIGLGCGKKGDPIPASAYTVSSFSNRSNLETASNLNSCI